MCVRCKLSVHAASTPNVHCLQVWSTNNIEGVHRFLARVYRLITEQPLVDRPPSQQELRLLHATIKKVWQHG